MNNDEILALATKLAQETLDDAQINLGLVVNASFKSGYQAGIVKGISYMLEQKEKE